MMKKSTKVMRIASAVLVIGFLITSGILFIGRVFLGYEGEKEPVYEIYPMTEFYKEAKDGESVFQGFFHNTSYDDTTRFLVNGPQTTSETAKEIAKTINDNKDLTTMMEIYEYIMSNLSHGEGPKFSRTTEEIFASGIVTGCTDSGLAFISIVREKGIPAVFIQTARIDWIHDLVRDQDDIIYGHIFVEVLLDDTWYLIDSTSGRMYLNYDANNFSLNDGYYVFSKSVEVYDTGVENQEGNSINMRELFIHFNEDAYVDPHYQYIDLTTGEIKGVERVEIPEPDLVIAFEDQIFEETIREYYEIDEGEITWKDIGYRTELDLEDFDISGEIASLNDLKWFSNLEVLILTDAPIRGDTESLKTLANLRFINMLRTDIYGDLGDIGELKHLEFLSLENTRVAGELRDIRNLSSLTELCLNGEWITGDISSLKDLENLKCLYLENMNVTGDIGSLNTLVQLQEISLVGTDIYGDIGDLHGLDNLVDAEFEGADLKGQLMLPNGDIISVDD